MKLLIVTQAVDKNDPVLGFFHRWIEEFAKYCEQVTVLALRVGEHSLPANCIVVTLRPRPHQGKVETALRFFGEVLTRRKNYSAVFVHMNPEYVLLGGILWRFMGKQVGLWYTHKHVGLRLRLAECLVQHIFTASVESFRLPTRKLQVMGHGLDWPEGSAEKATTGGRIRILTVGRVSRTKRLIEMLSALDVLNARGIDFSFTVVGAPVTREDESYKEELIGHIATRPYREQVFMMGPIRHEALPHILRNADVFINLSSTGSLDKAVLEALCAQVPVVSSNEAFVSLLTPLGLQVESLDSELLAGTILHATTVDTSALSARVRSQHSLARLIPAILTVLTRLP